ncbi:MAG: hypothetical protein IT452_20960 [Planctomycetia bacterium]|nr:hypothetical protein [Planctomycetia bacterium]
MSQSEKPVEAPGAPVAAPSAVPVVDPAAAAVAAIARDAKAQPEEYLKSTTVPGGGE